MSPNNFYDAFKPKPTPPPAASNRLFTAADAKRGGRYAACALELECEQLAARPKGERDHAINTAAFQIGTLIGAGVLNEDEAVAALWVAARATGQPDHEIANALRRGADRNAATGGIETGKANPRVIPERDEPRFAPVTVLGPPPVAPVPLDEAQAVFSRWLHLDDIAPVLAVAATIVANLTEGDPVWILIVGPPSGGKTEILISCAGLPYMRSAATISEAALLSGTAKKERARDATGGLLRQIGDFGILLAKDFTSVLSQNKDTAKAAMAALREIYDGRWDRPVGSDGGRVLNWEGKCGFVGGVTPSFDRYAAVVSALGDRFILLRLPDVDANSQALSALDNGEHEKQMRAELSRVMCGLVDGADKSKVYAPLTEVERDRLVKLATFTARARTAVERDGYSGDLLVMPQPEGPARLVKAMRRLYGALDAIGADEYTRWHVLHRIARDCAPAIRLPIMQTLIDATVPLRTTEVAAIAGLVGKTALRQLEDLALIGLVCKAKAGHAENSTYMWTATEWLREFFPPELVRQRNTPHTKHC